MKKSVGLFVTKIFGWRIDRDLPSELFEQCVIIAAPHTSNWDYLVAISSLTALGVNLRYTIKKQWMASPIGWIFKFLGGIGVDRTPRIDGDPSPGLVDAIANLFHEHKKLSILVSAEGTRSLRTQWKTGFYYIALTAEVPIALGYLDYANKVAGVGKILVPSGNLENDMLEIMEFYKDISPKIPDYFALDERFYPQKIVG